MGVKFEDDIWFEIVEEEKRSQSESQTLDVIVYEIFDFKDKTLPYSLTIIDTPGYGNTKEVERDVIVTQRLFDLFRSKKGEFMKLMQLTACIQNLQDRIKLIELKRREIEQTQSALKKYEQQMKMNKEFTVEVDEVYKGKETIDVAWSPGRCEVMKKGRCTVCKRKCLASAHVKEDWIYVSKTRKVKKTLTDVKEKYERNKAETVKAASLLENLQKEMENLEEDKARWLEEAYEHVDRLNQIALNVDSLSTYVHYDFLIEKMKEKGDTEKVQKLEEKTHRVGEMVRTGAQYAYERICKIFKGNKNNRSDTEV
ncbi:uncharacterized protein AKAME5_000916100 [Lates japonicus]|uniref:AIG1-type G domain-containing protein n=1 Tax=Lates japonicus TaxID=270547 RepID=A0AAD3MP21_LATJO|nr:uncharacterized protein AKAME5_000916100 [Lates japonicus]